jgi:hypothetical protein
MRHPHRARTIALRFVGLGAISLAAWFWVGTEHVGVRVALFVFGTMALAFGGLFALFGHQDARAKEALARGEDIIARWRVEADDWQRFVASDPQWSSHAQGRPNEFRPSEAVESNGVELIVGKAAVQIGESIHRVSLRSIPEITEARLHDGTPPIIELLLYYPPYATRFGMRPPRYTALRFPVGRGAVADARRVVAHFRGDLGGEPDFFHGRGDGTNPEDLSRCYNCGYETHKFRSRCPKCGTTLQSRRWSRRFGLLLVIGGVIICGLMGYRAAGHRAVAAQPGSAVQRNAVYRHAGKGANVLAIFGAVLAFGLTALGYGLWQMVTGRRSKKVIYFLMALAAGLVLVALLV